jgi:protein TonB
MSSMQQRQSIGARLSGWAVVLALHGVVLYGLWSYRVLPTPAETITMVVNLVNPPVTQPQPPVSAPPEPRKPEPVPAPVQPEHQHLVAETPALAPDEPLAYLPPPEAEVALPATITLPAVQTVAQPITLSGELSVICLERPKPAYPTMAKRMNEQGKATVRVELSADGQVINATVKTSSGYKRLDEAAINAVKTWRCNPAILNGVAVPAYATQQFSFTLEDR